MSLTTTRRPVRLIATKREGVTQMAQTAQATKAGQTAKAPAKRVSKVDPNETKEQRFRRLARQRMTKALKAISSVGKLSGPGYAHTPEQATEIVNLLAGAVRGVQTAFSGATTKEGPTFETL